MVYCNRLATTAFLLQLAQYEVVDVHTLYKALITDISFRWFIPVNLTYRRATLSIRRLQNRRLRARRAELMGNVVKADTATEYDGQWVCPSYCGNVSDSHFNNIGPTDVPEYTQLSIHVQVSKPEHRHRLTTQNL